MWVSCYQMHLIKLKSSLLSKMWTSASAALSAMESTAMENLRTCLIWAWLIRSVLSLVRRIIAWSLLIRSTAWCPGVHRLQKHPWLRPHRKEFSAWQGLKKPQKKRAKMAVEPAKTSWCSLISRQRLHQATIRKTFRRMSGTWSTVIWIEALCCRRSPSWALRSVSVW